MKGLLEQLAAWKTRRAVELKSPIDGIVIPIHGQRNDALLQRPGEEIVRRPGEVVRAGIPILAVAEAEPTEVVAYVNEQQLGCLKKGMPVELVKTRTPRPDRGVPDRRLGADDRVDAATAVAQSESPQWGLPVLIRIPSGLDLIPGEVVGVRGL